MPTYDYKCTACSHTFEQFQSIKDKPLKTCPECGRKALERLIGTGGAIIFKGGGFYQTDYRSESYKKAAEADKAPGASSESKPPKDDVKTDGASASAKAEKKLESKPDSKPISTPESKPQAKAAAKGKGTSKAD